MTTEQLLDKQAAALISRLLRVIEEQKQIIAKHEGAIEGVKLFLTELKAALPKERRRGPTKQAD